MTHLLRWVATALLVVVTSVLLAGSAQAHPTDEVVQQVYLTPARSGLTVQLDLSPGVLVARQFVATVDTDGDGTLSPAEVDAHAAAVGAAVTVEADGRPVALTAGARHYPDAAVLAAGGGPVTLGWTAALPADARQVVVIDRYVAVGRPAVQMSVLVSADPVPLGPIEHAEGGRRMTVATGQGAGPAPAASPAAPAPGPTGAGLVDALRRPLTSPAALALLVGACALLGGLHALTPGHGKALLAAYLVGDRGTPRQAVGLGLVITVTHTAAVLVLGGAVLAAGRDTLPGAVVPVLTAAAGAVVLILGLRLVRRRWTAARVPVAAGHGHGHEPLGTRGLAALGVTAGMIPCPEALSVLLLAVGLNRTALGLVMIVAFSVGLAAVLICLGLLLVTAAPAILARTGARPGWLSVRLPLVSALVVTALGGAMTVAGLAGLTV